MKTLIRSLGTLALLCLLPISSPAVAQHEHGEEAAGHSHQKSESHGGSSTMTKDFHFETVFRHDGVMIYLYDGSQSPLDAKGVSGTVEIAFRDRARKPLHVELKTVSGEAGEVGYLRGDLDLSQVADGKAKATVEIHGLSGRSEKEVSFRETVRLAKDDDHHSEEGGDGHDEKKSHDDGHGHG